jgi:hypothetical protein
MTKLRTHRVSIDLALEHLLADLHTELHAYWASDCGIRHVVDARAKLRGGPPVASKLKTSFYSKIAHLTTRSEVSGLENAIQMVAQRYRVRDAVEHTILRAHMCSQ